MNKQLLLSAKILIEDGAENKNAGYFSESKIKHHLTISIYVLFEITGAENERSHFLSFPSFCLSVSCTNPNKSSDVRCELLLLTLQSVANPKGRLDDIAACPLWLSQTQLLPCQVQRQTFHIGKRSLKCWPVMWETYLCYAFCIVCHLLSFSHFLPCFYTVD